MSTTGLSNTWDPFPNKTSGKKEGERGGAFLVSVLLIGSSYESDEE